MIPRIAITPGDLAGVGPDLCLKMAQQSSPAQWVAYADINALKARAEYLNIDLSWHIFEPESPPVAHQAGCILVHPVKNTEATTLGKPNTKHAPYLIDSLIQNDENIKWQN